MSGPTNDVSLDQNDFSTQSSSRSGCSVPRRTTANDDKLFFDVHSSETIGTPIQPAAVVVVVVVAGVVVVEEVVEGVVVVVDVEVVVDTGTVEVVEVLVVDVVVVDTGTVDVVVVVDVVEVVVVSATNCGNCNGCTGTGFGQYRDGYPNLSRGSPTYSKCMPSAGQKLPPHANPHLRKMWTILQFISGTRPWALVTVLMSRAIPHA